jgi:hypothetical protein
MGRMECVAQFICEKHHDTGSRWKLKVETADWD